MNKKSSILSEFKQFVMDNLWFVLLLTPLFVIAVMMFKHFQPTDSSRRVNGGLAMVVGSVEISTAELASIVAKPLTELIAMEVYSVVNHSAATAGPIRKSELKQATYNPLSEIRRAEDNPIRVISYTITDQTTTKIIREAS
jgi:hypothetical protein